MAYYGNNVYNEKSYKVAVRRAKKDLNKNKNVTTSSANEFKQSNKIENKNEKNIIINNELNQKNLINIPKAYKFFKQRKLEEYEVSNKLYSKSELEKHIQRAWKNSPENPLNQISIKENIEISSKYSLKKISNEKKKNIRKNNRNNFKINIDY
ncbi:hypothetical protein LY90DRAFT_506504 [Neocallimastix californiae]|uniref:HMG box domain-containing protein n=1 Tax=Neocallimastix californiae TaxID=1754190 RepID=A0A1Y2DDL1_9FUNG|nr:hypothetical protein LY90DRAFT_506504 [Neocallimastix californiae]|eukprot:ORY57350.1 hypothetical protein LY90DRAFT_506504 [Neocallimastix californiae]